MPITSSNNGGISSNRGRSSSSGGRYVPPEKIGPVFDYRMQSSKRPKSGLKLPVEQKPSKFNSKEYREKWDVVRLMGPYERGGTVNRKTEEETPEQDKSQTTDTALEIVHAALDAAGMVPALGIVPDAINTGVYLIEGDWVNAGFAAAAMIPIFGQGATTTKYGLKVSKEVIERVGRDGIERGVKELAQHAIAQKARAIRNLTEDILLKMEGFKNGHLLTKHSGKNVDYLKRRLVNEPKIEAATTFYNTAIATKAVRQNLSHNADEIAKWLADKGSASPRFTIKFKHTFAVGKGFERGTKRLQENLNISSITLIKDSTVDVGFRILTGHPVIK